MKVPDKIYVREYPDGIAHFWESKKKEDVAATIPHEYIRKDALLEYLYTAQGAVGSDFQKAVIQSVIDKLNSM